MPEDIESSPIKRLTRGIRNVYKITVNRNYDEHVDPQQYDEWRRRTGGYIIQRIANVLAKYIPSQNEVGSKAKVLELTAGIGAVSEASKKAFDQNFGDYFIQTVK